MSVKIHHGPPGSYKTSGAVMDDFVDAVYDGRVIITNVRGLNDQDRVIEVLNKNFPRREIPSTFELVWVDSETEEGIDLLKSFWIWADCGAFLLIDEAQSFWPSEMRPSEYEKLILPGGVDAARLQGRPRDYTDAWTRHRHFNWDIVLTTPDIKLFHNKIRSVSEAAYIHKNQAVIGLKGRYLEGMHLASNNGFSSDLVSVRQRKIPSWVFSLYQSTSTGVVSDTKAGLAFWKDPKILDLSIFFLILVVFLVSRGNPFNIFKADQTIYSEYDPDFVPSQVASSSSSVSDLSGSDPFSFLIGKSLYFVGDSSLTLSNSSVSVFYFELIASNELQGSIITSDALTTLGFSIQRINRNLFILEKDGRKFYSRSRGIKSDKKDFL